MVAALQQPAYLLSLTHYEEDRQHQHKRKDSLFTYLGSKVDSGHSTKVSLWIDGCSNSSCCVEELRKGVLVLTYEELADMHHEHSVSSGLAFSQPQNGNRIATVLQDDCNAFVALLRACAKRKDICKGSKIHDEILKRGWLERCSDALVTMYAKCGALAKAKALLDMHKSTDVITWSALIAGYARVGQSQDALDSFERMQLEGIPPDAVTYTSVLKAYGTARAAEEGKKIHDEIVKQGLLKKNIVLGGALIDMYAKCGVLSMAHRVLEELPCRNVVTWNALIAGYAREEHGQQVLTCFECMQSEGISPDSVTYTCVLKACGTLRDADMGQQIHDKVANQGLLHNNTVLGGALVGMYAKCGDLQKARRVLEELSSRTVVSWSALITGYVQEGQAEEALNCLNCMQRENISPDAVTYACILKACGISGAVDKGKEIHDEILRQGLLRDNNVLSGALVDMYAKCGALAEAQRVLEELPSRDVVSWSALIAGYASKAQGELALSCFNRMRHEGISPDAVTYASILKACGSLGALDKGEEIHEQVTRQGLLQIDDVLGGTLVDMYAKCGALSKAHCVLDELPSRDVVAWSALIAGYVQEGRGEQALNCFECMQQEGILPNVVTLGSVLNVCNHLGLVEQGHLFFGSMRSKFGVEPNSECYTCMVDLLGRAGHLERAVKLIHEMSYCDNAAIWHALLGACLKWRDVNIGRWAFEQAVQVDRSDGSAYVLMANLYAAAGMYQNAKSIEALRMENKAWNKPLQSLWIDAGGGVLGFLVQHTKESQKNPGNNIKLGEITHKIFQQEYSSRFSLVSSNISDVTKESLLCSQLEKWALHVPSSTPLKTSLYLS